MTSEERKHTPQALIITGYGLNCENETACAFRRAGAEVTFVHLKDLLGARLDLQTFHILALVGGFSFGDHLGAGTVFANRIKYRMQEELKTFVDTGGLVIGICNGFQTLTRLGLVPGFGEEDMFRQRVALAENEQGVFRDAWISVAPAPESPCVFTQNISSMPLPVRHGEGRFIAENDDILQRLEEKGLVALRYVDAHGNTARSFPDNPNGSVNGIAGICSPSGRVFGLMPHPEAYISPYNHPYWQRRSIAGDLPNEGRGLEFFRAGVNYVRENVLG